MKRFIKAFHKSQKGFTLMELLIVVAILGIIAGVVALNLGGFLIIGKLNAANTEAENIKTAAVAHYGERSAWPSNSTDLTPYIRGTLTGTYNFDGDGLISSASGWDGLTWNSTGQKWERSQQ